MKYGRFLYAPDKWLKTSITFYKKLLVIQLGMNYF